MQTIKVFLGLMIFVIISPFLFFACSNTSEYTYPNTPFSKNIILYIEGNNNLHYYADSLVASIVRDTVSFNKQEISLSIVYDNPDNTRIFYINKGTQKTFSKQNALDGSVLRRIIEQCIDKQQAKEYGLILWSHGSGWIRTNTTRSFGDDNGKDINIDELSESLPVKFNYIIFDACYMSCLEVVAELVNHVDYIVASPELVPSDGIIDANSIKILLKDSSIEARLMMLCDYYKNKHVKYKEEVSAALIRTASIVELMDKVKSLPSIDMNEYDANNLVCYDYRRFKLFYDFNSVLTSGLSKNLDYDINTLIRYKVFSGTVKHEGAGISIFIPFESNSIYFKSYKGTCWNKYTGWLDKWRY